MVEYTFNSLMGCHSLFLDLLTVHQERLREHDLPGARTALREFKNVLRLHVEDEEKFVLPIYGARVSAAPEAEEEVFHKDHACLARLLEDIGRRVSVLEAGEGLVSGVAAVLELQEKFRRLFIVHAEREELLLYPHMDRITTPEERRRLLHLCRLPDPRTTLSPSRAQERRPSAVADPTP